MIKRTVKASKKYDILIENGIIKNIGENISIIKKNCNVAVISDSNVAPLYADDVIASLEKNGYTSSLFVFPAGEQSKNLDTIQKIYHHLANNEITRKDLIIALGGGVTGDMAGFAAATWLRGIDFVQIPTSLLSQIDSSVGGKTGTDLPEGKNLVGAFHQPILVAIDPTVLNTLPEYYFNDGMGEAIKYGCIKSKDLFDRLLNENAADFLENLIFSCIDIKASIVERDEFESGERMLLNFGHTLAHSLEKIYNFQKLSHGQAVGIGMVLISKAGENAGLTQKGTANKIINILKKYNLPVSDSAKISEICSCASMDKKRAQSSLSLILLDEIGSAFIHSIDIGNLEDFLKEVN